MTKVHSSLKKSRQENGVLTGLSCFDRGKGKLFSFLNEKEFLALIQKVEKVFFGQSLNELKLDSIGQIELKVRSLIYGWMISNRYLVVIVTIVIWFFRARIVLNRIISGLTCP